MTNTQFSLSQLSHRVSARKLSLRMAAGLLGGICLSSLLPFFMARPASAAERVTLTYGFVEISTTVDSLRTFAETGVADDELSPYLRFLNEEQRSQFRQALNVRRDVDPVQISQFMYSAIGQNILRSVGDIVRTAGRRDGSKAMRGALVLAAADPEGLSLLGVLDHFATSNVRIDSQRAFRLFNSFTGLITNTNNAIAAIEAQKEPTSRLSPTVPALTELSEPGMYPVSMETLTVVDSARDRSLPTDLYLPQGLPAGERSPVVIISHGLSGDRKGFVSVAEHLASHGYAVAALDHPASNRTQLEALFRGAEQEIAEPTEFSDRPRDISYLLDELTLRSDTSRLDIDSIAVIGHSFGGYTVLALSGAQLDLETLQTNCASDDFIYNAANPSMVLQCTALLAPNQFDLDLRDERIDAVIALNPVTSSLFGPEGFSQIAIPSLFVAGSVDPLAPALLEQIRPFTWLDQTQENTVSHYLALIEGGSHLYDPLEVEGAENVTLSNSLVSADAPLATRYLKSMSLGFLRAELDENPIYKGALDDASILQIGERSLPLFLVSTLTEEMLRPPSAPPEEPVETITDPSSTDPTNTEQSN